MNEVRVKIVNHSDNPAPSYATQHSAGMDLRAWLDEPVVIQPMQRLLIPTGVHIELPEGYECQLRPRSGLAIKHGITLVNTPGTIDADYRGEIKVIMINLGETPFTIESGERICQMVVAPYSRVEWTTADSLEASERGEGGFGHTGR